MSTKLCAAALLLFGVFASSAAATPSTLEVALTYPESVVAPVEALPTMVADGAVEPTSAIDSCCEPSCAGDCCCEDSCCDDSCCDQDCGSGCGASMVSAMCCPMWTVRTGAVILSRSRPDNGATVIPLAGPGRIADGSDLSYGWAAGPDVSLLRRTSRGNTWELRYFGALDWDTNMPVYGAVGNVRIGSFSNFGATGLTGRASSSLDSAELNWRHPMGERFTLISGARWIELGDDLTYNIVFPAFNADYNWNTNNHLYGAQLGGDFKLWRLSGPLSVNAQFKGGGYSNVQDNDFTLRPSTGGVFDGGARNDDRLAFVGEINLTTAYQLTRHFALRGGYQLLWIDGVTLATDQAAASTAASSQTVINTDGQVFYHGAMMSADLTW